MRDKLLVWFAVASLDYLVNICMVFPCRLMLGAIFVIHNLVALINLNFFKFPPTDVSSGKIRKPDHQIEAAKTIATTNADTSSGTSDDCTPSEADMEEGNDTFSRQSSFCPPFLMTITMVSLRDILDITKFFTSYRPSEALSSQRWYFDVKSG